MNIKVAQARDASALADLFFATLKANPQYISHGEIQMGIATGTFKDGIICTEIAPEGYEKWQKYIKTHIIDSSFAEVWKALDDEGHIIGFCVADIEDDGDEPFGMICDIIVDPTIRSKGVGSALLQTAIAWLKKRGVRDIFLESGKDNHSAHEFFARRGFHPISHIFKLDD